ncbi:hypothetical protein ES704_03667 [subsurface metagenome]|jgi:hypothetical protein
MKYLNDIVRVSNYSKTACQRDKSKLRDLLNVYLKVFGEILKTSCGNCIGDGIIKLQIELRKYNLTNKIKQEIMAKEERKYVMTPNSIIDMAYSTGEYFTSDNMTDEKARKLIKKNPVYLKWFDKYPKDEVDKILGKSEVPEKKKIVPGTGSVKLGKDEKSKEEEKKVATPDAIDAMVKDNSKDALIEKAKNIPGINLDNQDEKFLAEMNKAVIAKMILEA